MMLEIQVLAWDKHKIYDTVKQVNGIPTLPLLLISNYNTDKQNTCTDSFPLK